MPGQQMPQDDLVLRDNPSLSWITAPQPIADVQTHVEPVTASRLGQQKYSAESFRMCKTLNPILFQAQGNQSLSSMEIPYLYILM